MVTTRGKRPAAAGNAASDEAANGPDTNTRYGTSILSHDGAGEQTTPTVGTRLRKRRRTGSPPPEEAQATPKRSNIKKGASPETKRVHSTASSLKVSSGNSVDVPSLSTATESFANNLSPAVPFIQDPALDTPSNVQPERRLKGSGTKPNPGTDMSQSLANAHPDYAKIIDKIIDHGESVNNQYASQGFNPENLNTSDHMLGLGASQQLQTQSLPILDNLATQILTTFAKSTYQEILTLTSIAESEQGQAYSTLKSLFDHTKKVYSIQDPFLSSQELGLVETGQSAIIRKANLATFVSSVFGSHDVGFYHLNEFFLDTFILDGGRLLKSQAGLFLDLKTQAYISAISNGERSRDEILNDLFPTNLEERILSRRPGAKQPTPSEADFIQRAQNRSKALMDESVTSQAVAQLSDKYMWEDFLKDISTYISKHFPTIAGSSARKPQRAGRPSNFFVADPQHQPSPRPQQSHRQSQTQDRLGPAMQAPNTGVAQMMPDTDDIAEKAARAAQFAMQDFNMIQDGAGNSHQQSQSQSQQQMQQPTPQQEYQYQFEHQPATPYYNQAQFLQGQQQAHEHQVGINQAQQSYPDPNSIPFPTQTAPTQVLYERARMAATAKASPANRRAGHPSQRRPWSTEEENALMAGLDRVKGPHWSQILAMFGPGGTVNETLKDRNQVQLKDKARNLKLFFLKSGIEVPYYLQFVTGELKTRAPGASKREAQAREAKAKEETQGDTSMALSDGVQNEEPVVDGAEEQDAAMEDGEGEVIDPMEYAAVHGAGNDNNSKIDPQLSNQGGPSVDPTSLEQQLYQAATANMNSGTPQPGGRARNVTPRGIRRNIGPQVAIMTPGPHAPS